MRRLRLPSPPSVDELAELARFLAGEAPVLLPALLWSICRNPRAVSAFRESRGPSSLHLAVLHTYATGARLISSSDAGAQWLRKWLRTRSALDDLPIAPDDSADGAGTP